MCVPDRCATHRASSYGRKGLTKGFGAPLAPPCCCWGLRVEGVHAGVSAAVAGSKLSIASGPGVCVAIENMTGTQTFVGSHPLGLALSAAATRSTKSMGGGPAARTTSARVSVLNAAPL